MVSLFGSRNANDQRMDERIDERFGLLSNRLDFIEYDRLVRLESNVDHLKRCETTMVLSENRMSLLQAKLGSLACDLDKLKERVDGPAQPAALQTPVPTAPPLALMPLRNREHDLMDFVEFHNSGEPLLHLPSTPPPGILSATEKAPTLQH